MFESAELGHQVSKESWDREIPALREALLDAQYDLRTARFPVIILVADLIGAINRGAAGAQVAGGAQIEHAAGCQHTCQRQAGLLQQAQGLMVHQEAGQHLFGIGHAPHPHPG